MGFGAKSRCKLWSITEDKGKFADCNISSNTKVGDKWEKDFSSKYVRFVGDAYKKIKDVAIPSNGINITLTSCTAQNCYMKDGQTTYLKSGRFIVFDFDWTDGEPAKVSADDSFMDIVDDGEVPFA